MHWNLKVQEPSGEERIIPIKGHTVLGRGENCQVILRDPTLPSEAATLWIRDPHSHSPFWIKMLHDAQPAFLGDLRIKEAQIPNGVPFKIGETSFSIETPTPQLLLPSFPPHIRPWFTCSDSGKQLLWTAKKAASTPLSLYLAGETGTGKEVIAQLLHAWSPRKSGPFVPIHCGALPLSLAESELFGHTKGAFTGAHQHRPGALMQAHGGTLFLDEIGDLPLDIQVKLLRFLENGEIRPVGADLPSRANVRLICATHHPLQKLVEQEKFRRDLYYRLASVTLQLPTLRSRPEDIVMLAKKFSHELNRSITSRGMLRLQSHMWPGNVRELRHAIERASGLASPFSPLLDEDAFDFLLSPESIVESASLPEWGTSALSLSEIERIALLKALKLSFGNRAKAANLLGVARSTLFEMLKRHRVAGPRYLHQYAVSQPATLPASK